MLNLENYVEGLDREDFVPAIGMQCMGSASSGRSAAAGRETQTHAEDHRPGSFSTANADEDGLGLNRRVGGGTNRETLIELKRLISCRTP